MVKKFEHKVVLISLFDIISRTEELEEDNPKLKEIIRQMDEEADLSMLEEENRLKMAKLEFVLREFAKEKGFQV